MKEITQIICAVVVFIFSVVAITVLMAWPVQLLWNNLIPDLLGVKTLTFFQALELSLLCDFLFKRTNSDSKKKD